MIQIFSYVFEKLKSVSQSKITCLIMDYCSVQKKKKGRLFRMAGEAEDETGNANLSQFIKEI